MIRWIVICLVWSSLALANANLAIDPTALLTGGALTGTAMPDLAGTPSTNTPTQELHARIEKISQDLKELQELASKSAALAGQPGDENTPLASVIAPITAKGGPITYFLNIVSQSVVTIEEAFESASEAVVRKWDQRETWLHVWHSPEARRHLLHALGQIGWILTTILLLNLALHYGLVRVWRLHSSPEQRQSRLHRIALALQMLVRDLVPPSLSFAMALVLFHFVALEHHTKVIVMALLMTVAAIRIIPHIVSVSLSAMTALHRPWLSVLGRAVSRLGIALVLIHFLDELICVLLELPSALPLDHVYALVMAYTLIRYILSCRHDVAMWLIESLHQQTHTNHKFLQTWSGIVASWHLPMIGLILGGYVLFLLEEGYSRFMQPIACVFLLLLAYGMFYNVSHFWGWVTQTMNRSEARTLFLVTYHRSITRITKILILIAFSILISEIWGFKVSAWIHQSPLASAIFLKSFSISVILVASMILIRAGTRFITRFMQRYDEAQHTHSPRIRSMAAILRHTLIWLISIPAFLLMMAELGFNTTPILASLSIGSLGLGLASQNVFKDVFAGLSIILENTMSVGDVVILDSRQGQVEEITMRFVRLRSDDGALHTFPLSSIGYITNCSRDYAFTLLNLSFRHEDDLDTIYKVLQEGVEHLRKTSPCDRLILEPLEIRGVDVMNELTLQIQVRIKTVPGQQWLVKRAFLTRIKDTLIAAGLQPPISEHAVYLMNVPELKISTGQQPGAAPHA